MNVEAAPKIFLQNRLSRSRASLQELEPLILSTQSDLDRLCKKLQNCKIDHSIGEIDNIVDNFMDAQHQLVSYSNLRCVLDAEIETVTSAVGGREPVMVTINS